ncbi:MAG: hypothetical protein JRC86_06830 [Deltaproteobacteria bacterium]|nr:hypothetical protein [Deltaproteobacteria bacterium]
MAWTDQCRIAFNVTAKSIALREKRPNISKILKKLSKESGIPAKTLNRWYYDKSYLKNEATTTPEHSSEKDEATPVATQVIRKCYYCQENNVERCSKSKTQKYSGHGLCTTCRKKRTQDEVAVCPYCDKIF